jgi:multidrug transporter EmrE-like cation transporter
VVGFLGGILVLKERHNLGWKALALLVMIAGVIVVNWKR